MKVLLIQAVGGLGAAGDLVEVADGYGRNYLVPHGKGVRATRGIEKQASDIKRAHQASAVRNLDHANEVAEQLAELSVRLPARVGAGGRLFGSVTSADIAEAVHAAGGPQLDKRTILIDGHIKSTGKHTVSVHLHPEVTPTFTVDVVRA